MTADEVSEFGTRLPFAIQRLNSTTPWDEHRQTLCNNDTSGQGRAKDSVAVPLSVIEEEPDPNGNASVADVTVNGTRIVCKLTLQYFKGRLIEHFDIKGKETR